MAEEIKIADKSFWDEIDWDKVEFHKIKKEDFLRLKSVNKKLFATFLGSQDQLQFYLFKPLTWGKYKEIRSKELDKDVVHEYILNSSILWPQMNPVSIVNLDAGVMLTLVNQVLAVSNFLKEPDKALELILEVPD